MSLAPVLPIRPQATLSPSDRAWASRVAAMAYQFGVGTRGVRRMMTGFPSECVDATVSELAAIANGAA